MWAAKPRCWIRTPEVLMHHPKGLRGHPREHAQAGKQARLNRNMRAGQRDHEGAAALTGEVGAEEGGPDQAVVCASSKTIHCSFSHMVSQKMVPPPAVTQRPQRQVITLNPD